MLDIPLHIFPGGGFDSSIVTVVFVGLLAMWWLAESFGFVFIGLVVPGYLASVMIIAPTTAVVVLVESVVTYLIVRALADLFSRVDVWSVFFGRDRFFAFLLVSLFVRLIGELWIWPEAWSLWTKWSGFSPHLPGALTSVGLVLVPLAANMFWKVGVIRGLWQLGLPTALVWGVTVLVMLPLTNLRFSEFQVHYEDVAIDMIASPKAYVIMIIAAAMAARANIRFGWDYGGILIPALLAISWFDVTKGAITLGEAVLLAAVAGGLMKLPAVRRLNLEGARKLVFVFSVGYLLKFCLSWGVVSLAPHIRVTDFFGFGYLLSSLLALKILQRKSVPMVLVPTVAVSVAGFVVGGVLVGGLGFLQRMSAPQGEAHQSAAVSFEGDIRQKAVLSAPLTGSAVRGGEPVRVDELASYEQLVRSLVLGRHGPNWPARRLQRNAGEIGLELDVRERGADRVVVLAEPTTSYPDVRGWGMVVVRQRARGPTLLVPDSTGDPIRVLAMLELAERTDAAVILFGARARTPSGRVLDPRHAASSPYHVAARQLQGTDCLEVLFGGSRVAWIETAIGPDFPLSQVTEVVGGEQVRWGDAPTPPIQRGLADSWVTLSLDRRTVLKLASGAADESGFRRELLLGEAVEGWLLGADRLAARALYELGEPISRAEFEVARRGVLQPLLAMAESPPPRWVARDLVAAVQATAGSLGLVVEQLERHGQCWWTVRDRGEPPRGWGVVAVRCDGGAPLALLDPFPIRETTTWRFAVTMAGAFDARVLALGAPTRGLGEHPRGDPLVQPSLLTAAHRAVNLAAMRTGRPGVWTLQLRGLAAHRPLDSDVMISREAPFSPAQLPPALTAIADRLGEAHIEVVTDDGRLEWAPLRGLPNAPHSYSRRVAEGRYATLWLSAEFRDRLSPQPDVEVIEEIARSLGTGSVGSGDSRASGADLITARDELVTIGQRFASTRNPLELQQLVRRMSELGADPRVWAEPGTERVWVTSSTSDGSLFGVRVQPADPGVHLTELTLLDAIEASSFVIPEEL